MGVASRRKIDDLTSGHRIIINHKIAVLGDKVDPEVDIVTVDKKIIKPTPRQKVYYLLNKPKFVLSSSSDDRGRKTVIDFVPKTPRVFPVGRLDYESTGLIILTNDGDFALKITHPRFHLPKVYLITILGKVPLVKIALMNTSVSKAELVNYQNNQTIVKITLFTGKKRQIRLLCASLHLHLLDLHRISIGSIEIKKLAPGEYRELTPNELTSIRL